MPGGVKSFGPIPDLNFKSLCCQGRMIIDNNCDLTIRNAIIRNLEIKNELISDGVIKGTNKLTLKNTIINGKMYSKENEYSRIAYIKGNVSAGSNVVIPPINGIFNPSTVIITHHPCDGVITSIDQNGNALYESIGNTITEIDSYQYSIEDICGLKNTITQYICRPPSATGPFLNGNCINESFSIPDSIRIFGTRANPLGITYDGTHIWVANYSSSRVSKYLESSGEFIYSVPVGVNPSQLQFDGTHVWVANRGSNNVMKIDPVTNTVIATYSSGGVQPIGLLFDGTFMWITNITSGTVVKMMLNGTIVGTFPSAGTSPFGMCFDGTHVWIVNLSGSVHKILATTGAPAAGSPYPIAGQPYFCAYDGTHVWVTMYNSATGTMATRLLATTGGFVDNIAVGTGPLGIIFDGTDIWVNNRHGVRQFNVSGVNLKIYNIQNNSVFYNLISVGTTIWTTGFSSSKFARIKNQTTLDIYSQSIDVPSSAIITNDPIDPSSVNITRIEEPVNSVLTQLCLVNFSGWVDTQSTPIIVSDSWSTTPGGYTATQSTTNNDPISFLTGDIDVCEYMMQFNMTAITSDNNGGIGFAIGYPNSEYLLILWESNGPNIYHVIGGTRTLLYQGVVYRNISWILNTTYTWRVEYVQDYVQFYINNRLEFNFMWTFPGNAFISLVTENQSCRFEEAFKWTNITCPCSAIISDSNWTNVGGNVISASADSMGVVTVDTTEIQKAVRVGVTIDDTSGKPSNEALLYYGFNCIKHINLVQTLTINSTSTVPISTNFNGNPNKMYAFVVRGLIQNDIFSNPASRVDAVFWTLTYPSGPWTGPYPANFVTIDGTSTWKNDGNVNLDHRYLDIRQGTSSPFSLFVPDTNHTDNLGTFTCEIYEICGGGQCPPPESLVFEQLNGVPGTEDGIVTDGSGTRQMYRRYNIVFLNGLTGVVNISGTNSNQQFWARPSGIYWQLFKASTFNATTSNNSNANFKWNNYGEGSRITITFDQSVSNVSFSFGDLDGNAVAEVANISPEANAYRQIAGGTTAAGIAINSNGIYRYRPPSGDDNNSIILYWRGPLTTISFTFCEQFSLGIGGVELYCHIPDAATVVS